MCNCSIQLPDCHFLITNGRLEWPGSWWCFLSYNHDDHYPGSVKFPDITSTLHSTHVLLIHIMDMPVLLPAIPEYCKYLSQFNYYIYNNRFMALWNLSKTTWVSRYQKCKTKTNLDFLEQEIVSGSGICWAICNAYSLRPPARSLPAGDTWVHLIPHSTHLQSSSLHGAVKAGSLSEIEKRALPPPCFPSSNF